MTPELSRRLGRALGDHVTSTRERTVIVKAAESAETWDDLALDVRALVEDIEARLTTTETLNGPLTAAVESHSGAMVALVPRAEDAARLAVDGGEDEEQLHVTLAFLGQAAAVPTAARGEIIERTLQHVVDVPVTGNAFGVSEFNPQGDEPCVVLIIGDDTGALEELQRHVCEVIDDVRDDGWKMPDQRSPWVPHITLLYAEHGDVDVDQFATLTGPVIFDRIRVAFADEVVDIPLGVISA